jgi:hypothetical protein
MFKKSFISKVVVTNAYFPLFTYNNNNNNSNNNDLIAFPHSGSSMLQVSLIIR